MLWHSSSIRVVSTSNAIPSYEHGRRARLEVSHCKSAEAVSAKVTVPLHTNPAWQSQGPNIHRPEADMLSPVRMSTW